MEALTRTDVHDYVKRKLGYPFVSVELAEEQIDDAISDTLDLMNQYLFEPVIKTYRDQVDDVVIDLSEDDPIGIFKVRALLPDTLTSYARLSIFELMYRMVLPRLNVGDWYLEKMFFEMFQKVHGTEVDFYYNRRNKTLYVDCHGGPHDLMVVIGKDLTLETLQECHPSYRNKFKKAVVGFAKQVLGRSLSKFQNVPAPGGPLATDGTTLRTEGEREVKEVEEALKKGITPPLAPILG